MKNNLFILFFLLLTFISCSPTNEELIKDENLTELQKRVKEGLDLNQKTEKGRTLLHSAAHYGKSKSIQYLIDNKADINLKDEEGISALHFNADCYKFLESSERAKACTTAGGLLLKLKANINAETNFGWQPLHIAAMLGKTEYVKMLLKYKPNLNHKTKKGFTPFHLAAANGYIEVLKVLIKAGANIHLRDEGKYNALHMVARYGEIETAKFLIQKGINQKLKTYKNETFLEVAKNKGKSTFVKVMNEYLKELEG